jgi:hypothetical protein
MPRLEGEVFLLGTAMAGPAYLKLLLYQCDIALPSGQEALGAACRWSDKAHPRAKAGLYRKYRALQALSR